MKDTLGNVKSTRFCITVIGSSAVGKTGKDLKFKIKNLLLIMDFLALTVQYLTGRFIGEYYTGSDMTYRHTVPFFGGSLTTHVDILDISRANNVSVFFAFTCKEVYLRSHSWIGGRRTGTLD